ncbi:MAG: AAA family ATPase [Longimicrobiales bacterium]|nr:AAA family ATPase [Longimicrobiales bacterium]
MTAEELAHRLKARRSGKEWQAKCPAHEDRKPSLSIGAGRDGRVLLKCHAGCETDAILDALGLEPADLFQDAPSANGSGPHVAAEYDYRDEDGNLLYQVVRLEPKGFRQRRPDGSGGWLWNVRDTRNVPYRLAELVEAVALDKPVWIAEGEKDAEALREAGHTATTNRGGAGKWLAAFARYFEGADVVIVADRDRPGIEHAECVLASVQPIAKKARIVVAAEGKDVSDHLSAGRDIREFVKLTPELRAAIAGEDEVEEGEDEGFDLPDPQPLFSYPAEELEWVVERLVQAGELGQIVGGDGSMKSTFALYMALCIAGGHPVLGRFTVKEGPVLYVSEEDGIARLQTRGKALCRGHGWSWADVNDRLHALIRQGVLLEDEAWQAHLIAHAQRLGVVAVVFDPLRDLTLAEENSNTQAAPLTRFFRRLNELPSRPAVIVLHHFGKAGTGENRKAIGERPRGASALKAACRFMLALQKRDGSVSISLLKHTDTDGWDGFGFTYRITEREGKRGTWDTACLEYSEAAAIDERADVEAVVQVVTANPGQAKRRVRDGVVKAHGIPGPRAYDALAEAVRDGLVVVEKDGQTHRLYPASEAAAVPLEGVGV